MAAHAFDYNVEMFCTGCSGAIERILNKSKDNNELVDFKVVLDEKSVHIDSANDNYMYFVDKFNKARKWVYEAKVDGETRDVPDVEQLKAPKPAESNAS